MSFKTFHRYQCRYRDLFSYIIVFLYIKNEKIISWQDWWFWHWIWQSCTVDALTALLLVGTRSLDGIFELNIKHASETFTNSCIFTTNSTCMVTKALSLVRIPRPVPLSRSPFVRIPRPPRYRYYRYRNPNVNVGEQIASTTSLVFLNIYFLCTQI